MKILLLLSSVLCCHCLPQSSERCISPAGNFFGETKITQDACGNTKGADNYEFNWNITLLPNKQCTSKVLLTNKVMNLNGINYLVRDKLLLVSDEDKVLGEAEVEIYSQDTGEYLCMKSYDVKFRKEK